MSKCLDCPAQAMPKRYWCADCDAKRIARIDAQFAAIEKAFAKAEKSK